MWNSVNVLATRVLFTNIYRAKLVCTSTSSVIKLDQNTLSPSILSKWTALLFRGIQMDGRGGGLQKKQSIDVRRIPALGKSVAMLALETHNSSISTASAAKSHHSSRNIHEIVHQHVKSCEGSAEQMNLSATI